MEVVGHVKEFVTDCALNSLWGSCKISDRVVITEHFGFFLDPPIQACQTHTAWPAVSLTCLLQHLILSYLRALYVLIPLPEELLPPFFPGCLLSIFQMSALKRDLL